MLLRVPTDAATEIASWLTGPDIARCEAVCVSWRNMLSPKAKPPSNVGAIVWQSAKRALLASSAARETETLVAVARDTLADATTKGAVPPKARYLRTFCHVNGLCPYCYKKGEPAPRKGQKPLCVYFSPPAMRPTPAPSAKAGKEPATLNI